MGTEVINSTPFGRTLFFLSFPVKRHIFYYSEFTITITLSITFNNVQNENCFYTLMLLYAVLPPASRTQWMWIIELLYFFPFRFWSLWCQPVQKWRDMYSSDKRVQVHLSSWIQRRSMSRSGYKTLQTLPILLAKNNYWLWKLPLFNAIKFNNQ